MKKTIDFFLWKREASLFDAKLYVLKSFVAVLTAYGIGHQLPIVQKDMISILFGLMMTLEPVTVTGIRSGVNQIIATILGALSTAVIITVLGINLFTVALSVSATLFLCLKINWREVSPVAIFTSIYMSQYVQYSANGEPSEWLTFVVRILALTFGLLIAVFYNFLFSQFFYKEMERKRISYLFDSIAGHMLQIKKGLEENQVSVFYREKELLQNTFGGIDWLISLLHDKEKEEKFKGTRLSGGPSHEIAGFKKILYCLRNITHLIYDLLYLLTNEAVILDANERVSIAAELENYAAECGNLSHRYKKEAVNGTKAVVCGSKFVPTENRIRNDLAGIKDMLDQLKVFK